MARDGAGNLAAYEKEVTLQSSQGRPSGGFSGGGGGGSSSTVATTHATSDTTAVVAYDGVELVVADQPMSSLVMGETELELFLRPDESLLARLGEDYQPAFTATLSNWMEDAHRPPRMTWLRRLPRRTLPRRRTRPSPGTSTAPCTKSWRPAVLITWCSRWGIR